jgi:hypothetical protein
VSSVDGRVLRNSEPRTRSGPEGSSLKRCTKCAVRSARPEPAAGPAPVSQRSKTNRTAIHFPSRVTQDLRAPEPDTVLSITLQPDLLRSGKRQTRHRGGNWVGALAYLAHLRWSRTSKTGIRRRVAKMCPVATRNCLAMAFRRSEPGFRAFNAIECRYPALNLHGIGKSRDPSQSGRTKPRPPPAFPP